MSILYMKFMLYMPNVYQVLLGRDVESLSAKEIFNCARMSWHVGIPDDAPPRAPTRPRKRIGQFSPDIVPLHDCSAPRSYEAIAGLSEEAGKERDGVLQRAALRESEVNSCRLQTQILP